MKKYIITFLGLFLSLSASVPTYATVLINEKTDLTNAHQCLENSAYVYVVPVNMEKHFFTVTLSRVIREESGTDDDVLTEAG